MAWAVLVAGAVLLMVGVFLPGEGTGPFKNPLGVGGVVGEAIGFIAIATVFAIFGVLVLSALSLVFRYRSAGGVERQQLKWFVSAAALFDGSFVFGGFLGKDLPDVWDALFETVTSWASP